MAPDALAAAPLQRPEWPAADSCIFRKNGGKRPHPRKGWRASRRLAPPLSVMLRWPRMAYPRRRPSTGQAPRFAGCSSSSRLPRCSFSASRCRASCIPQRRRNPQHSWIYRRYSGGGLLYIVAHALDFGHNPVQIATADYGTKFAVVAGLLNFIAAIDAHNIGMGRKP